MIITRIHNTGKNFLIRVKDSPSVRTSFGMLLLSEDSDSGLRTGLTIPFSIAYNVASVREEILILW